jgi:tight adherence protein B
MNLVLVLVAIVLMVAGLAGLVAIVMIDRAAAEDARKRVDLLASRSAPPTDPPNASLPEGRGAARLRSILGYGVSRSWPSKIGAPVLLMGSMTGSVVLACALLAWLKTPPLATVAAAAVGAFLVPQALLRLEQGRQDKAFVNVLPDGIDMIVRMIRAGLPMAAAVRVVGQEASSPVREVFAAIADQMSVGVTFERALLAAGKTITSEDFRFFTVASALQQSTGGNLATTLESLSVLVRKRRAGRMKAKAVTAEARMSSYVLAAIPFVIVGALAIIDPAYLAPLITDPRGNFILLMAAGSLFTGFFIMYSLMRGVTKV